MSLGTSLLKPDGVGKRKHKLVDDYPAACGVSPKRIMVSDSDKREQLRVSYVSHPRENVRVCALKIGSWDLSTVVSQSGADILLCRKKAEVASNCWRMDNSHDVSVIGTGDATRIAFRPSRVSVGRQIGFDCSGDLLARQSHEALLGDAFFRSATFAYLSTFATSRAAIIELRDVQTGAQFIVCSLDATKPSGNGQLSSSSMTSIERLPILVVEACAILNEAQKLVSCSNSSVLLFVADDEDEESCYSLLDEIIEAGYPNSEAITQLQRIRMRSAGASSATSNAVDTVSQTALIDEFWHFFQHSVVGLRRAAAGRSSSSNQRRFPLWFTTSIPEIARVEGESSEYAAIDFNVNVS